MDRQDFMDIVYAKLASDPDNNRANRIIWAADGYAEHATDINVGTKIRREQLELARAIDGLTEWQKHVQTDSNINRDITVAIEALKAQLGTNLAEVGTDTISRQAAIDIISQHTFYNDYDDTDKCSLLDELRTLPPAQPEPCEDAVSRKAAIRACGGYMVPVGIIKALPPVTPKQRTGKWLINCDGYYPYCSECGTEPESGVMTDFCPNCGAKMEGDAE